ncbi:MAG: 23S rRNA (adenine(1618)-N(6))-methyltransferase RlmF [Rhodanobacter denitrificans]|uniref:Ribosomal RNA large subunit methyltransferase F n=1 Tax=Rhodanobacter denitrificans TaxID=666685 RepID=A0A2W5M1E9_9GAMM|nr:MAG: 23S rRNA (adenine(1618)-N(6))-methyltransferase RlmF [Rhodanobacter denitrificans]
MRSPPRRPPGARSGHVQPTLHPRNRHSGRYNFARLTRACAALKPFLLRTPDGDTSIDFGDAGAVRALNRALLAADYGIAHWDLPDGYLCPPIPGRADYLHGLADLLAENEGGTAPRGPAIRVLDVGVGASCIYPLLGHADYGWCFVGTEVDATALQAARTIVQANGLGEAIELRRQPARDRLFAGVVLADERFDLTMCNPPFHASAAAAAAGSRRKWRNLDRAPPRGDGRPALNFGGRATELWCPGGEVAFVGRMIEESAGFRTQVRWFSSLVAKSEHRAALHRRLRQAGARDVREVPMAQGSKQSRFIAWTFLDAEQQRTWRAR